MARVPEDGGHVSRIGFRHHIIDAAGPHDPHVKVVGDVDGDGCADVVVASSDGGPLVWYQYPEWQKRIIHPSGKWSCSAQLVDMDGDGDLDILISEWYGENRLEWFENPRPRPDWLTRPWERHLIGHPRAHDIAIGDIDGDGAMEIATRQQNESGRAVVIWKRIAGVWQSRAIACPEGEGLDIGDIDGDGDLEIVIGGRWYDAPRDLLADPWPEHIFAEWPPDAAVKLADMNGDGRLDVVLTRSEGRHRLSWFEAPVGSAGRWAEHVVDDDLDFAHSLVVCDVTGDGLPDIVTAEMHQSARGRVLVYVSEGDTWARQVVAETGSHNLCVAGLAAGGRSAIVGANWSGEYQPVEMWEIEPRS